MLFFKKKQKTKNSKVDILRNNVSVAFSKVKEDINILYQWIEYLSSQNQQLQVMVNNLRTELKLLPKTDQEIKYIIDKYYSFDHLFSRLDEVENKLLAVERGVSKRLENVKPRITHTTRKLGEQKQRLQETIARRISKNSKEYIKKILVSLIEKYENLAGPQLKEIVVEEQRLCSKSSFYRLLEELRKEEKIGVISNGKFKYFTVNLSTRN